MNRSGRSVHLRERFRGLALLLVLLSTGAQNRRALAREWPVAESVDFQFLGCSAPEAEEIRRLVSIDVASTPELSRLPRGGVVVSCDVGRFELRLLPPLAPLSRSLNLKRAMPRARARLVAIEIVELLAAAANQPEQSMTLQLQVPASDVRDQAEALPPSSTLRLQAFGSMLTLTRGISKLMGGGLRSSAERGFPWSFDVAFEGGAVSTNDGRVSVTSISSGVFGNWIVQPENPMLRVGAGVRGGAVRMVGHPSSERVVADSIVRGWGGPLLNAGLVLTLYGPLFTELAGEAGYVVFPVHAIVSGAREVSLRGVWLSGQLGLGLRL